MADGGEDGFKAAPERGDLRDAPPLPRLLPTAPARPPVRPGRSVEPALVLVLVQKAALAHRRMQERAAELVSRWQAAAEQGAAELRAAKARIDAAEARAALAERRAREAEAQVQELEEWLDRIDDLVMAEFDPARRPTPPLGNGSALQELRRTLDAGEPSGTAGEAPAPPPSGDAASEGRSSVRSAIGYLRRSLTASGS